ncbi:MAG: sigma-70 family RNA polymerase sigma factor [Bacteroidales bacterium]|nr:sigma-70 family RNA polymerase sigma factor [Bacteroidales bacterium]MCF8388659.1 sigma-70 family RNA polymerase sigma factor [Bacteroidales bacterium]MCF8397974.1 sigma-70 family RNA polymerase sigma factor [Bacteroidales bacterium]
MNSDQKYIEACLKNDPKAQAKLFRKYFNRMYIICLRLAKNNMDADDILQEGFIKVFANLKSFRNEGSLESWMRRIMINTSFNFYKRKYPSFQEVDFEKISIPRHKPADALDLIAEKDISCLVEELPKGYKKVFMLSAVQGYTHKEIGKMLHISKNTSKSQLNRAKTSLKEKISNVFQYEDFNSYYENCLAG